MMVFRVHVMHSNIGRVIGNTLIAVWIQKLDPHVLPHMSMHGSSISCKVLGAKMPDCCDVTCSVTHRIIVAALLQLQQWLHCYSYSSMLVIDMAHIHA